MIQCPIKHLTQCLAHCKCPISQEPLLLSYNIPTGKWVLGLVYLPSTGLRMLILKMRERPNCLSTSGQLWSRGWKSTVHITLLHCLHSNYMKLSCSCIHFLSSYLSPHHNADAWRTGLCSAQRPTDAQRRKEGNHWALTFCHVLWQELSAVLSLSPS